MEKSIEEFLIRAKRKTYAAKGKEVKSSRLGSHDLRYEEEDFMYYDSYLGGEKFAGEEALWIKGTPYWSMNYIGRVLEEEFSGDFLKEALLNVKENKPYRGPELYVKDNYTYKADISGDFEWFQGREIIEYNGKLVYECYFHGGLIK